MLYSYLEIQRILDSCSPQRSFLDFKIEISGHAFVMTKMKQLLSLKYSLVFAILSLAISSVRGDVTLPAVISEHAVLQKSEKTRIWGNATAGEKIKVALGTAKGEATAGVDGKWRVELNLTSVGVGPFDLMVSGNNQITVKDVIVGEVWVASGQSNMEWLLKSTNGAEAEIAASENPHLRQFLLTKNAAPQLQDDCKGAWVVAGPATAGGFSAVGYHFAKNVYQTLKVPVGLIHTSWGGTQVEAWTSMEALNSNPELKQGTERIFKSIADFDGLKKAYEVGYQEWVKKYAREDKATDPTPFADPKAITTDWKKLTLPGKFKDAGLPDAGVVWLRKVVTLDEAQASASLSLHLPQPEGFESIYYNGKLRASMTLEKFQGTGMQRQYTLGPGLVGENVIAIRLYNPKGNGGLFGGAGRFKLGPIGLKGEWLGKAESELSPLTEEANTSYPKAPQALPGLQGRPAHLYQGMIHPVLPYTIQGAIWYQGEANVSRAYQYQTSFPLMIQDWRKRWGYDFAFYFCQLANFQPKKTTPGDSSWAELREAQNKTLSLPNTGQAILIDVGEADDIHPWSKKEVGERLALSALAKTYGKKDLIYSGPTYDSFKVEAGKVRIAFKSPTGGLVAKPLEATYLSSTVKNERPPLVRNSPKSELEGFMICGEDKKWEWADAKIEGETVLVWSDAVSKPVAVRYGWAENPTVNLYNKSGLPAGPFKTDDFPWITEKTKY